MDGAAAVEVEAGADDCCCCGCCFAYLDRGETALGATSFEARVGDFGVAVAVESLGTVAVAGVADRFWLAAATGFPPSFFGSRRALLFCVLAGALLIGDEAGVMTFNFVLFVLVFLVILVLRLLLPASWGDAADLGLTGTASLPFGVARDGFAPDAGNKFLAAGLVPLLPGVVLAAP